MQPGGGAASEHAAVGEEPLGPPPPQPSDDPRSEFEAGADVHHRRSPRVDRSDDLLDIDSLQIQARRGDVRMPELPLDDLFLGACPALWPGIAAGERRRPAASSNNSED